MSSLSGTTPIFGVFSFSAEDKQLKSVFHNLREEIWWELNNKRKLNVEGLDLLPDVFIEGYYGDEETLKIMRSSFFIQMMTPSAAENENVRNYLTKFLERERLLGRNDLTFPLLYISIPDLNDDTRWRNDPFLSVIAARGYVDWRQLDATLSKRDVVLKAVSSFSDEIASPGFRSEAQRG